MTEEKYDFYLLKDKDGRLMKFSYDIHQGIYYEIFINHNWSEKKSIYKESLEYFCVLEESSGEIYVFCQDICGDIILCVLEEEKWNYKTLLHMRQDVIMPIYIKAFFSLNDIHLLYNIVDKHTYSEVLVHQVGKNGVEWSRPQILGKLDYHCRFPYYIYQDCKCKLILLSTMLSGVYQLTSRNFHVVEGTWGKEEIIHTSLLPYIDFTFCTEENRRHYLFITQDDQVNRVIYQYKDITLQKNTVLFQHESIDSCLLIPSNESLWALWICENKLYGCVSIDYGQSFSKPRIYKQFGEELPIKVFYQENYIANQLYVMKLYEEEFFLKELLQEPLKEEWENDTSCEIEDLKIKLKTAEEELKELKVDMEHEKNQVLKLQYELYKKKEKIKFYTNDNERLNEKNSYLEEKLLSKDKEAQNLKRQIDFIQNQYMRNSEKLMKKSESDNFKQMKFSFIKWLFDDENQGDLL